MNIFKTNTYNFKLQLIAINNFSIIKWMIAFFFLLINFAQDFKLTWSIIVFSTMIFIICAFEIFLKPFFYKLVYPKHNISLRFLFQNFTIFQIFKRLFKSNIDKNHKTPNKNPYKICVFIFIFYLSVEIIALIFEIIIKMDANKIHFIWLSVLPIVFIILIYFLIEARAIAQRMGETYKLNKIQIKKITKSIITFKEVK